MNFKGKTVLVTGASGGIGRAIATGFTKAGADLILGYRTNLEEAQSLENELEQSGARVSLHGFDASIEAQVEASFTAISKYENLPDVLINNAGSFPLSATIKTSASKWDEVQAANLRSAFLCSREMIKLWLARKQGGSIIGIASIAASLSQQDLTDYCAAKAGMVAMNRNLAAEFGPKSIRVNTVSPGLVWRDGLQTDWPEGVQKWKKTAPLGDLVQPDDVANACLFLASDQANSITGVNLMVDAGISVARPF